MAAHTDVLESGISPGVESCLPIAAEAGARDSAARRRGLAPAPRGRMHEQSRGAGACDSRRHTATHPDRRPSDSDPDPDAIPNGDA